MSLRVVVLGNCQADGVASCLKTLCPETEVTSYHWGPLSLEKRARLATEVAAFDIVLSQFADQDILGELRTPILQQRAHLLELYPSIHFTGFHPDALPVPQQLRLPSPFGRWHSLLVLACHQLKVPQPRVPDLFNAYIYSVLGYFDEYDKACSFHAQTSNAIGWKLEDWKQDDAFVHLPNHPKINVFWSIAGRLCDKLGLLTVGSAKMPDDTLLRYSQWPVYPEISRRLNVGGSLLFKPPRDLPALQLEDVVRWYYDRYPQSSAVDLDLPRLKDAMAILRREGV
jgi:hypothetical protein